MSEKWYRVNLIFVNANSAIEEVLVEKDTASMVILANGSRAAKNSEWRCYRKSWEECKQLLIDHVQMDVNKYRTNLMRCESYLESVKVLTRKDK